MSRTVKELREERHWSQYELAMKLGVRPETIWKWEKGRMAPYGRNLRKLAEVFHVPMDEIAIDKRDDEGGD